MRKRWNDETIIVFLLGFIVLFAGTAGAALIPGTYNGGTGTFTGDYINNTADRKSTIPDGFFGYWYASGPIDSMSR